MPELVAIEKGKAAFLLQNYYVKAFAENLQMHLLVNDVDAWWAQKPLRGRDSTIRRRAQNGLVTRN